MDIIYEEQQIATLFNQGYINEAGGVDRPASIAVANDGCIAIALESSVLLVHRGTQNIIQEFFSLNGIYSGKHTGMGEDEDLSRKDDNSIIYARSMVWSKDGDSLGITVSNGGAILITRDGKMLIHIFEQRDLSQTSSILNRFFGFARGGTAGIENDDRRIISIPLSGMGLLTAHKSGKIFAHHDDTLKGSLVACDFGKGASLVAAASNGSILVVIKSRNVKNGHLLSVCLMNILSYEPYSQIMDEVDLPSAEDVVGAHDVLVCVAISRNEEYVAVSVETRVYNYVIKKRAGGSNRFTNQNLVFVGEKTVGILSEPSSKIASICFWSATDIALSLLSGHNMALNVESLSVSMAPIKESSSNYKIAAGQGRELIILAKDHSTNIDGNYIENTDNSEKWQVRCRIQRTPEEMLVYYVDRSDWDRAHELANKYNLDHDHIYISRFEAELSLGYIVDKCLLDATLGKLHSDESIASLCVRSICNSIEEQTELIEYGLIHAVRSMDCSCHAMLLRLTLLQHRERLGTYAEMSHKVWDKDAFQAFRDGDIETIASDLARAGQLSALQVVFYRHAAALIGHELKVASYIPSNMPPELVLSLVPSVGRNLLPIPQLAKDWVEEPEVFQKVYEKVMSGNAAFSRALTSTEWISRNSHDSDSRDILESDLELWIMARARNIEAASGRLDLARQTIELSKVTGINLSNTFTKDVEDLFHAVYDGGHWNLSLNEFEMMSNYSKFVLLSTEKTSSSESILEKHVNQSKSGQSALVHKSISALRKRAMPYLRRIKVLEKTDGQNNKENDIFENTFEFLGYENSESDFILRMLHNEIAANDYKFCCDIMESASNDFKTDSNLDDSIFESPDDMATAAISCVYSIPAESVHHAKSIIDFVPRDLISPDITDLLQRAQAHVRCSAMLKKYGILMKPIEFLHRMDPDLREPITLLKRVLGNLTRLEGKQKNDWNSVWKDLKLLHDDFGPLESVSDSQLLSEYVGSLLRAGKMNLGRQFLFQKDVEENAERIALPRDESEILILAIGKEFAGSATSMLSQEINTAREIFSLARWSEQCRKQLDILDALQLSKMIGFEILPIEMENYSDSSTIVETIFKNAPEVWRQPEQVFEIASLLGLNSNEQKASINMILAKALLSHDQFEDASKYAIDLVRANYEPAWELAQHISQNGSLSSDVREELSSFALQFCPEESISGLLKTWIAVNTEQCKRESEGDLEDRFDLSLLSGASQLPLSLYDHNNSVAEPLLKLLTAHLRRLNDYSESDSKHTSELKYIGVCLQSFQNCRCISPILKCMCFAACSISNDKESNVIDGILQEISSCKQSSEIKKEVDDVLELRLHYHAYRAYLNAYSLMDDEERMTLPSLALQPREILAQLQAIDKTQCDDEHSLSSYAISEIHLAVDIERNASNSSDVSWICSHVPGGVDESAFNLDMTIRLATFTAAAMKVCMDQKSITRLIALCSTFGIDPSVVRMAQIESILRGRSNDFDVNLMIDVLLPSLLPADASKVVDLIENKVLSHWGYEGPKPERLEILFSILSKCYSNMQGYENKANRFSCYTDFLRNTPDTICVFAMIKVVESSLTDKEKKIELMQIFNFILGASHKDFKSLLDAVDGLRNIISIAGEEGYPNCLPTPSELAICHICKSLKNAADVSPKDVSHGIQNIDANTRWRQPLVERFESLQNDLILLSPDISMRFAEYLLLSGPVPNSFCIDVLCVDDHRLPLPHPAMMCLILEKIKFLSKDQSVYENCILSAKYMNCMLLSGAIESFHLSGNLMEFSKMYCDAHVTLPKLCFVFKFNEIWRIIEELHDASIVEEPSEMIVLVYKTAAADALIELSKNSNSSTTKSNDADLTIIHNLMLSLSEPNSGELIAEINDVRHVVWEALRSQKGSEISKEASLSNVKLLQELSDMIGVSKNSKHGDLLWGSWQLPEGDRSQTELLFHATREAMDELWNSESHFVFDLNELNTISGAKEKFSTMVTQRAARVGFGDCWLALTHAYLSMGSIESALNIIDKEMICGEMLSESEVSELTSSFDLIGGRDTGLTVSLLLANGSLSYARELDDLWSHHNEGTVLLTAEILAIFLYTDKILHKLEESSFQTVVKIQSLFDKMFAMLVSENSNSQNSGDCGTISALRILLPAVLAVLTNNGLALQAADLLLRLSHTHPLLCSSDAGLYLLDRTLKANASLVTVLPLCDDSKKERKLQ